MKEIHILHLMPKLLSLYGEYGNVAILRKVLQDHGFSVTVDAWEAGSLRLEGYDFIYVGSGTEDNLLEAAKRLAPHVDPIRSSIASGTCWLATGNAMSLFGHSGLSIFSYDCEMDTKTRYMGDVLTEDIFGAPLVGYINTSCKFHDITEPLVAIQFGKKLGNAKDGSTQEGICHQNFYGTQLIGPVLVKNPHFLEKLGGLITGGHISIDPESNQGKAYAITLQELQNRAAN